MKNISGIVLDEIAALRSLVHSSLDSAEKARLLGDENNRQWYCGKAFAFCMSADRLFKVKQELENVQATRKEGEVVRANPLDYGPPHQDDPPCDICGRDPALCVCPECDGCGLCGVPLTSTANGTRLCPQCEQRQRAAYPGPGCVELEHFVLPDSACPTCGEDIADDSCLCDCDEELGGEGGGE